jgi:hypothetical protein
MSTRLKNEMGLKQRLKETDEAKETMSKENATLKQKVCGMEGR